jgi:hypothetical protein
MKRVTRISLGALATGIIGTCPLLSSTGAQAAITSVASSCSSTFCGPATATLLIGGKTYKFKSGTCRSIKVSDTTVDVDLGDVVVGKNGGPIKGNGKRPWFSMDLSTPNSDQINAIYYGGKELTPGGPITVTGNVTKSGSSKGTFQTKSGAFDLSGNPFSLSGSWNCHGKFIKG